MLVLAYLRSETETAVAGLVRKGVSDAQEQVQAILAMDEKRRSIQVQADEARSRMNTAAKEIGAAMGKGDKALAEQLKAETAQLKADIATYEQQQTELEAELQHKLVALPNVPHPDVPNGLTAADNKTVLEENREVNLPEQPLPHWELADKLGLIDFARGSQVTGAGFPVYVGAGAKLQRALIHWMLDQAGAQGYREVQPPLLVNESSAFATGQLPDKEGQMYEATVDKLFLIPTAEVPLTNLYRDHLLQEEDLPVKICGYTPCFRREAGSYGKEVRGLNRLHQFDKVEIVQLTTPEASYDALEAMRAYVEGLVRALELPFRTLLLCAGDMTYSSAKTYDLEVYSAAQGLWLEVSSVSNFESYQANRLKLRYKPTGSKKPVIAHTLNGSAIALPRIVAALLENNQQADGSIRLPQVLHPYFGAEQIGPESSALPG